jgi:hypothetical protein
VKQEQLKYLKHVREYQQQRSDDSSDDFSNASSSASSEPGQRDIEDDKNFTSIRDLPDTVRDALLGMPHENKRRTETPWYDYFDQETLNLTYEMYRKDFEIFNYSPKLQQRPDLEVPDAPALEPGASA